MMELKQMTPMTRIAVLNLRPATRSVSAFQICMLVLVACLNQMCPRVSGQVSSSGNRIQAVVEARADGNCFVVQNLQDPSAARVRVWHSDSNIETSPSILGASSVDSGELVFTPRFPVQLGAEYVILVQPDPDAEPRSFRIVIPGESELRTEVVNFFPSADQLPENTLRFYVQFSAPMQKGDIYRYIRLKEVGGKDVELPFLEIEQEFWSRDSKRLTLLLDPGRIKRGLKPREEMGPVLAAGKTYELIIDQNWTDASGHELGKEFAKRFQVIAEDHTQPDPATWKIAVPTVGSREPLQILFPGPLDHAMLFLAINVVDSGSNDVMGVVTVSEQEKKWSLLPIQNWKPGSYKISVSKDLEDNSGNSIGRPFDVDLFEKTESPESTPMVELEFEIPK